MPFRGGADGDTQELVSSTDSPNDGTTHKDPRVISRRGSRCVVPVYWHDLQLWELLNTVGKKVRGETTTRPGGRRHATGFATLGQTFHDCTVHIFIVFCKLYYYLWFQVHLAFLYMLHTDSFTYKASKFSGALLETDIPLLSNKTSVLKFEEFPNNKHTIYYKMKVPPYTHVA